MVSGASLDVLTIQRKLEPPSLPQRLLARPRLVKRLEENRHRRLTLVCAPAGYGKSTLTLQWLASGTFPAAWVSLDAADRDPMRFLKAVVAALSRHPGCEFGQTNALLESSASPPWQHVTEVLLAEFVASRKRITLVLEDYHLADGSRIHELLEHLLEAAPENLRLVVMTRVDPPWPLARWRVRGWLSEIRARDLCLTFEETSGLLHDVWNIALEPDLLELMHRRTEGWIAGLRLAQLTLSEASDPNRKAQDLSGSEVYIADYLVAEVLTGLSPAMREFLAASALMERFSVPLMEHALAGTMQPGKIRQAISELEKKNLFLVTLDDRREWFRWHHLFHDLLLIHLEDQISPVRQSTINRDAGIWFAEEGFVEEAMQYCLAAGELDRAAELLGENLHAACTEDPSLQLIARWIDRFPKAARSEKLPLIVAEAYLHTNRFDLAGVERQLRRADKLPANLVTKHHLRADLEALQSHLYFWQGDAEKCLEHALATRKLRPAVGSRPWTYSSIYRPAALKFLGHSKEAFRHLDAAIAEAGPDSPFVAELLVAASVLHLYELNLGDCSALSDQLIALSKRIPMSSAWLGYAYHLAGMVAYEQNRLDDAKRYFKHLESFRYRVPSRLYQDALLGQALVAVARNNTESAKAYCSKARAYAIETGDPTSLHISRSFELRLGILRGNRLSEFNEPPPASDHQSYWLEVPTVSWAKYLVTQPGVERCKAAAEYIEEAIARMQHYHNVRQLFALEVLRCMVVDRLGERETALEVLAELLHRGAEHGLVRSFVDAGPSLKPLLEALSERTPADGYLESLRAAFTSSGSTYPATADFRQSLTYRELETLKLLAWHMTNKEIAAELSVSPAAVKKRLQNVFAKLDVHDRRAAIRKAIEEGLISQPQN
jgi:LuxR family maltose regulon positive regulatory protein